MEHRQERIPGQHVTVSIVNHGLGPATLTTVFFTVLSCPDKLTIDDLVALSKLPTKEVLLGQFLSVLNGVPTGLVQVLSAVPRTFLYGLRAIKEQKESAEN